MNLYVYDSAYYSGENGYVPRYVMWCIEDKTNRPVCLTLSGAYSEALLELPPIYGISEPWNLEKMTLPMKRILKIIGDEYKVTFEKRFRLFGYSEEPQFYAVVRAETRELINKLITNTKTDFASLFKGSLPIWRETEIDVMTKLFIQNKIPRTGWVRVPEESVKTPLSEYPIDHTPTLGCYEPTTSLNSTVYVYAPLSKIEPSDIKRAPKPLGAYLDIETLRHDLDGFPNPECPQDMVYMCAITFARLGTGSSALKKYCICIGFPDKARLKNVEVVSVEDEPELIKAIGDILSYENPDFISGFNIHDFDLKYIEMRMALHGCNFSNISRLPGKPSSFDLMRGPRGARYTTIKSPGQILLDLFLYLVKNTTRQELPSFSLAACAKHFLHKDESQKISLSYKDQFRLFLEYVLGYPTGPQGLGQIAEYCVRDTDILPELFENRGVWSSCASFSMIFGSTMQTNATSGQVEKLTPLLYMYVHHEGYVIETNKIAGTMKFEGGYVSLRASGYYKGMCIGDFASLYPSLIISENLCMTTRVLEHDTINILKKYGKENVMVVKLSYRVKVCESVDTSSDPDAIETGATIDDTSSDSEDEADFSEALSKRALRSARRNADKNQQFFDVTENVMYVKTGVKEGIIPKALKTLLAERKRIRTNIMPLLREKLSEAKASGKTDVVDQLKQELDDADKKQLATKVAANSIYGLMGAASPHADPFIGAVTTEKGREMIKKSTDIIVSASPNTREFVYTDTDSSMIADTYLKGYPVGALQNPIRTSVEQLGFKKDDFPVDVYSSLENFFHEWGVSRTQLERDLVIPHIEQYCIDMCALPDKSGIYTKPMKFEYEAFVIAGIWFSKKFYIARILDENREVTLKERGIMLRRGDYPEIAKQVYKKACFAFLDGLEPKRVIMGLIDGFMDILRGTGLTFDMCKISSDFKSIVEYVEPSCKMAVLARKAAQMGFPLQENSRVDIVMTEPDNVKASVIVSTSGHSERLMTRDMLEHSGTMLDKDHYVKILVSHIDKLVYCACSQYRDVKVQHNDISWNLGAPAASFVNVYKNCLLNFSSRTEAVENLEQIIYPLVCTVY